MTRLEIVPATEALTLAVLGKPAPLSFEGHVALLDGEPVGVGGVSFVNGWPLAFTDMKADRLGRKDRARCFRFLEAEFAKWKAPIYAICSESEPGARRLLARLGFRTDLPAPLPHWMTRLP